MLFEEGEDLDGAERDQEGDACLVALVDDRSVFAVSQIALA